jgi:hypothetical protein
MAGYMSGQWSNKRDEQGKPIRLSLNDLIVLVRQHTLEVTQARERLQHIYETFRDQGDIWFDECDYLLTSLHTMEVTISDLYKLFEETDHLPFVLIPLRYQLLAELCTAKDHLQSLTLSVQAFSYTCRVISIQAVKQHYAITRDQEELLKISKNITFHAQSLFDQARFLERRSIFDRAIG